MSLQKQDPSDCAQGWHRAGRKTRVQLIHESGGKTVFYLPNLSLIINIAE